jgi:hypothetical protein
MILVLLVVFTCACQIPQVEVNIRALGAMQGRDTPAVDVWMAHYLTPLAQLTDGEPIGTIG